MRKVAKMPPMAKSPEDVQMTLHMAVFPVPPEERRVEEVVM
jgi:hypothetical protein